MKLHMSMRTGLIAALCATVGVAGGIASGTAATSKHKSNAHSQGARHGGPRGGMHGFEVHADAVILNKAGTAFITATEDNGTVDSVSGDQLAVKESARSVTYKTVTLTIPSGATIIRNGATATLSDLKSGDHVHVSQSSDGTVVFAGDSSFRPGPGFGHDGRRGPPPGGPRPGGPWPPRP